MTWWAWTIGGIAAFLILGALGWLSWLDRLLLWALGDRAEDATEKARGFREEAEFRADQNAAKAAAMGEAAKEAVFGGGDDND